MKFSSIYSTVARVYLCNTCNEKKPINDFFPSGTTQCRSCIKNRNLLKAKTVAKIVDCACGCGQKLEDRSKWGYIRRFINHHGGRKERNPKSHRCRHCGKDRRCEEFYRSGIRYNWICKKCVLDHSKKERIELRSIALDLCGGKCFLENADCNGDLQVDHPIPVIRKMIRKNGRIYCNPKNSMTTGKNLYRRIVKDSYFYVNFIIGSKVQFHFQI